MSRRATLLLITLITLFTLPFVNFGEASIPNPTVPEFTLALVDKSYTAPQRTYSTTDPYTNKTTTTTIPAHYVENFTVEVTIKNQLFSSSVEGNTSSLFYNVRTKDHLMDDWVERYYFSDYSSGYLPVQSNSQFTVLSFPVSVHAPDIGQLDFQVEAILGYTYKYYLKNNPLPILTKTQVSLFVYESSGWSDTQTIDLRASTQLFNQSTTEILVLSAIIVIIVVAINIMVYLKKRKSKQGYL